MLTNPLSANDLARDGALLEALQSLLNCLSREPSALPGEGTQDLVNPKATDFCLSLSAISLVRFRWQIPLSLLWTVAPVLALFSKALRCFSDSSHVCAPQWPVWDLGVGLFAGRFLITVSISVFVMGLLRFSISS